MSKISVIYFSNTGNTEAMAKILAKGIEEGGKEAVLTEADKANANELINETVFALGCPACGSEQLDDSVMEDFVASLSGKLEGKTVVLFGSHDWGDGEWMRNWVEQMNSYGAAVLNGEGIIANLEPDSEAETKLLEAGKALAAL
jgi:flavodoxin